MAGKLSLYRSIALSIFSLFFSLSPSLSLSLSVSLSLPLFLSLSHFLALSFSHSLTLSLSPSLFCFLSLSLPLARYGVATVSRIDKLQVSFCRILSLFQGSFAKETYNFIDPTNQSHPIPPSMADSFSKVISLLKLARGGEVHSYIHASYTYTHHIYTHRKYMCIYILIHTYLYIYVHIHTYMYLTHVHIIYTHAGSSIDPDCDRPVHICACSYIHVSYTYTHLLWQCSLRRLHIYTYTVYIDYTHTAYIDYTYTVYIDVSSTYTHLQWRLCRACRTVCRRAQYIRKRANHNREGCPIHRLKSPM